MTKRTIVICIILALFVLISCRPSPAEPLAEKPDTTESILESGESGYELPEGVDPLPSPNPIDLIIALEEGNTSEMEIGVEGGSLEVTAVDGTLFRLVVPPDALFSPVTIKMTPSASVDGVPFEAGALAAVHLDPEGLIFFQSVELFIHPPSTVSLDEIVSFGTFADGKDFYLHPGLREAGEVRLLISHFSNYGVAAEVQKEIERLQQSYTPRQAEANAKNQAWVILDIVDDPSAQLDAYEKIAKQWFYNSVLIKLLDAEANEEVIDSAIGQYLNWFQFVDTMGLMTEGGSGELIQRLDLEIDLALNSIASALNNAFENARRRCVQNNQPEEALKMLRWGVVAGYLDVWGRSGFDKADATANLKSCFSFELVFRSRVKGKLDGKDFLSQVIARIPLKFDNDDLTYPFNITIANKGELNFEIRTVTPGEPNCTFPYKNGVLNAFIIVDLNFNYYGPPVVENLKLRIIINDSEAPEEIARCTGGGVSFDTPIPFWWPFYEEANKPFKEGNIFKFHLPIIREGEIFAKENLYGPVDPSKGNVTEDTTYELLHKPGG